MTRNETIAAETADDIVTFITSEYSIISATNTLMFLEEMVNKKVLHAILCSHQNDIDDTAKEFLKLDSCI